MNTRQDHTTSDSRPAHRYDVVVVGGGAAGLSGALVLARARRSVLVIDAGRPRNAPASGVHGYLAAEGRAPADLLRAGREEVTGYGGEVRTGTVLSAERRDGGDFRLTVDDGTTVIADRLLVTTGLVDELPDVPALAERWGRDVLHCPYCHGYEVRDRAIGILATGHHAVHQALMWRQWSHDVTLFLHTGPEPGDEAREQLVARGIAVVEGEVTGLRVDDDRLSAVVFGDGREVACEALAVAPRFNARTELLGGLGVTVTEQPEGGQFTGRYVVPADAFGATTVPGVWVAGNVANPMEQVVGSAAAGARAAMAVNADLIAADVRHAVAQRAARRGQAATSRQSVGQFGGDGHHVDQRAVADRGDLGTPADRIREQQSLQ